MNKSYVKKNITKTKKMNILLENPIYRSYIRDVESIPKMNKEEEMELIQKIKNGCQESKNIFWTKNLRLSIFFCQRFLESDIQKNNLIDLIQDANEGLLTAIEKYEPEKGAFSTYAQSWIYNRIQRFSMNTSGIRIPIHIQDARAKYNRFVEEYQEKNKTLPDAKTIMQKLKISKKIYDYITSDIFSYIKSLNEPIRNDEDDKNREFINTLTAKKTDEKKYDIKKLLQYISNLTPQEQIVIKLRYGFYDNPKTLSDCAELMFVSRERIRQVEINALEKLKKILHKNKITKTEDLEELVL